MIKRGAKITPDAIRAYEIFLPYWHKILAKHRAPH
jgi:hypothetical protein